LGYEIRDSEWVANPHRELIFMVILLIQTAKSCLAVTRVIIPSLPAPFPSSCLMYVNTVYALANGYAM
jgi:hypothetical protein